MNISKPIKRQDGTFTKMVRSNTKRDYLKRKKAGVDGLLRLTSANPLSDRVSHFSGWDDVQLIKDEPPEPKYFDQEEILKIMTK